MRLTLFGAIETPTITRRRPFGLSPALKFWAIGIRTIWKTTREAMNVAQSDEAKIGVRTWQQELAWREFYQQVMLHFPVLADGPYREHFKQFPWGDYVREWVPELKSVETKALLSGDIDKSLRDRIGYVKPIVNHVVQQRKFKERYADQEAIGQIE